MGCHLALGWPLPENVLDLFTEFRTYTNGTQLIARSGLLGALAFYGLPGIAELEKETMRERIMAGGP
jgi:DNA polymerase I